MPAQVLGVGAWSCGQGCSGQFPFFFLIVSSPVSSTCARFLLRRLSPSMAAPAGSRCMRSLYQKWVCLLLGCLLHWASCFEVEHMIDSPHPPPPEGESGEELVGGKNHRQRAPQVAEAEWVWRRWQWRMAVCSSTHTRVCEGALGLGCSRTQQSGGLPGGDFCGPPEGGRRHKGRGRVFVNRQVRKSWCAGERV